MTIALVSLKRSTEVRVYQMETELWPDMLEIDRKLVVGLSLQADQIAQNRTFPPSGIRYSIEPGIDLVSESLVVYSSLFMLPTREPLVPDKS